MEKTAYYDRDGNPELRLSYCVVLDFLGYKEKIQQSVRDGTEQELFEYFMQNIEPEIRKIFRPKEAPYPEDFPKAWCVKIFTDNIVMGDIIQTTHGENEFGHTLCYLQAFQLAAALQGFFVRGGWALGNLFINENTVFGEALLEAYRIESKETKYPRILLSRGNGRNDPHSVHGRIFEHIAFYSDCDTSPHSHHLIIDKEGDIMVHYLADLIYYDAALEIDEDGLKKHKEQIERCLDEYAGTEWICKYHWLAAYHNFFCNSLRGGVCPVNNSDVDDCLEHDVCAAMLNEVADECEIEGDFPDYGLRFLNDDDLRRWKSPEMNKP